MEITVISEEENPMLHRTDVRFRVSHAEATPDRLAIRDSLAARLNKNADEVVVRRLDTKFGMRETVGEAKVYQGADFAKEVEQDYQLDRNKIGEDGVEEGTPEAEAESAEEPAVAEAEPGDEPAEKAAAEGEAADAGDEAPEAEAESEAEDVEAQDVEAEDVEDDADEAEE